MAYIDKRSKLTGPTIWLTCVYIVHIVVYLCITGPGRVLECQREADAKTGELKAKFIGKANADNVSLFVYCSYFLNKF